MRGIPTTILFLSLCLAIAKAAPLRGPAPGNLDGKSQPATEQNQTHQPPPDQQNKSPSEWWLVGLTGALVSVGVVQSWVFWIQAGRLRQTIDIMGDTAERQLRAYVSANARSLLSFNSQMPICVTVGLQNAGQTPAHEMQFAGGVLVMEYPYRQGTDFNISFEGDVSKTVLHPGQTFVAHAAAKQRIPDEALTAIRDGTCWRLYVGGVVSYKNAFGRCRSTKFLASAGGRDFAEALSVAGGDPGRADLNWQHTREHNKAT